MADKTSSSRICTNTNQTKNNSSSTLVEANILSTQDKELLLILEELQGASISEDIDLLARHPSACSPQDIPLIINIPIVQTILLATLKTGVTNEGRLV